MEGEDVKIERDNCNGHDSSKRNSVDSSTNCTIDDVGIIGQSIINSYSISDIASVSSEASAAYTTRGTATSRMRFELAHGSHLHDNGSVDYLTPSQRKDKEVKSLRKERSQLLREKEEKELEMEALRHSLGTIREQLEVEKERELVEYAEKIKVCEREKYEQSEELTKVQDELSKREIQLEDVKNEMSAKEEIYEVNLQRMFKKGKRAATFEREEELEMLATTHKAPVSVKELTRKLSRTELELAKWQGLRLEQSYTQPGQPETQAEATLSFLKDSFFHFLTDRSGNEDHLRAMITIFKYSEVQLAKIRKGIEEFKRLDRKRMSLK